MMAARDRAHALARRSAGGTMSRRPSYAMSRGSTCPKRAQHMPSCCSARHVGRRRQTELIEILRKPVPCSPSLHCAVRALSYASNRTTHHCELVRPPSAAVAWFARRSCARRGSAPSPASSTTCTTVSGCNEHTGLHRIARPAQHSTTTTPGCTCVFTQHAYATAPRA